MNDPRHQPDFVPALFPHCDGQALAPRPDGTDPDWPAKLELLTAYYEINVFATRLEAIRTAASPSGLPGEPEAIARLQNAIVAQECISAKLAAQGIAASTQWEGVLARNVTFSCPPRDRRFVRAWFSVSMSGSEVRQPQA